ncbi:class I SAM-dependent methyltransferase [Cellvibrio sp. QJXJ]|jgi:predicted nicotinamide N-methyase|uniref:class I SAM-dependent methyltransferase n=1 Tax=Cellvibrio sp. QJXJ TaxID=2964606 RepID=UPI0021C29AA5|nr:protein N-lysine methyltransferase family protein [Cellvibrio sp. QJXJ]UUA72841.1 protein N-lysine methyltransferase family protein [Cellvibrio sp. QJXJ]
MTTLRVRYQTLEFGTTDIHIRSLRDNQEFSDDEGAAAALGISSASWPIFGIVWPSGEVLAHLMAEFDFAGKRILEVGCGIALASLILNHRRADITATDYHPGVADFLNKNTQLNKDRLIPFVRTGWNDALSDLGLFDVIIGSDLLYEAEHVELLAGFINQHAAAQCEVILIDPGRGHHAKFSKKMLSLGYSHSQNKVQVHTQEGRQNFSGQILRYQRI